MIEFKGSHFERAVILWAVRWYVACPISDRQLEEMMEEHDAEVDHATLNRWVLKICAVAGAGASSAQAAGGSQLSNGRDLCEGEGQLEVLASEPPFRLSGATMAAP
jgi:hypothetical protein